MRMETTMSLRVFRVGGYTIICLCVYIHRCIETCIYIYTHTHRVQVFKNKGNPET